MAVRKFEKGLTMTNLNEGAADLPVSALRAGDNGGSGGGTGGPENGEEIENAGTLTDTAETSTGAEAGAEAGETDTEAGETGETEAVEAGDETEATADSDMPPVVINFEEASKPHSELARSIAAEAEAQYAKLASNGDKGKRGRLATVASGTAGEIFMMNPYAITIAAGWNLRDFNNPANQEHVDNLARSIASIGVQQPLIVEVNRQTGQVVLTDGECRLRGALRAIEVYGIPIKGIPVRAESRTATDADKVAGQIYRNSGKNPEPLEMGTALVRLMNFGWSYKDMAEKTGLAAARVYQLIDLMATATEEIKRMVTIGQISATTAQTVLKDLGGDGAKAERVLKKAGRVAKKEGKTKIMPRHVAAVTNTRGPGRPRKETVAQAANATANVRSIITDVFADSTTDVDNSDETIVTIVMSSENWEKLLPFTGL